MTEEKKVCSRCKEPKYYSEFSKRNNSLDGHRGVCKSCTYLPTGIDYDAIIKERADLYLLNLRRCNKCNDIKSISEFYDRKDQKDNLSLRCGDCLRIDKVEERYRDYINPKNNLPFTYTDLVILHEEQNKECKICSTPLDIKDTKGNWALDHCHNSMIVRGILCTGCNMGLGYFKDSKELLQNAINYLHKKEF